MIELIMFVGIGFLFATSQFLEIGKKNEAIGRLKIELGEKAAQLFVLGAQERRLADDLQSTQAELAIKAGALEESRRALVSREAELAEVRANLPGNLVVTENRPGVGRKFTSPLVRAPLAPAAIAAAMALAGCNPAASPTATGRHMQPLSQSMLTELETKSMEKGSPILVRIFKEEAELDVWKQDKTGRFALLRTYPICRWSGELGPKVKQGDRQAPEGFYTIVPALMNPNSNYYLAINTGFPNAYDRANERTGALLMIHGDCSSSGCYAMTDEQIAEIYALAREAFSGGQKSFQVQALPFRMTPLNMARHRNSPHMAFWRMLKLGYDHFEIGHLEPKVDVCEKRYVFDAESMAQFSPDERCPAYRVPEHIAAAVRDKQRRDDTQTAELISRGAPAVQVTTGIDGGMHPTFLEALRSHGGPGATIRTTTGTIPAYVKPPVEPAQTTIGSVLNFASAAPPPVSLPRSSTQMALARETGSIGSFSVNPIEERGSGYRGAQCGRRDHVGDLQPGTLRRPRSASQQASPCQPYEPKGDE